MRTMHLNQAKSRRPIKSLNDAMAFRFKFGANQIAKAYLILDNEYCCHNILLLS
jgi:hypothetical protein